MGDLPWLRLYTDTVDNEKIRLLAFEDRWHYIALLCLKQQGVLSGQKGLMDRKIAVKLGLQIEALDELKRRLIEVDLILDDWTPKGWEKHQFLSDSSTARVRKYREKKKKEERNVTETLPKRSCNVIDTDTEEDKDTDKKKKQKPFTPPTVEQVRQYCEERRNNINPQSFVDHYTTSNWMRGKTKIKDWKACVRTWEQNNNNQTVSNKPLVPEFKR